MLDKPSESAERAPDRDLFRRFLITLVAAKSRAQRRGIARQRSLKSESISLPSGIFSPLSSASC